MGFTNLSPYLLILVLSLASQTLGNCPPSSKPKPPSVGPVPLPLPPITVPPVIGKPPITLPPIIGKPPITLPPIIGKPPITLPPIITPILPKPPATKPACPPPPAVKPPCPPKPTPTPAPASSCPVDTLKLGACVDILGAAVHIGDPAVECCPLIAGLAPIDAAACLCTTIKLKAIGVNAFFHIAFELLVTCGKTPPPGYTCV